LLEITAGCQDAYPADRPAEDVGPFGMVPGADDVRPRAAGGSRA
jgi:hypothetical protein